MDWSFLTHLSFGWRDALDIALVTLIFYNILIFVKKNRAVAAVYGLVLLFITFVVARELSLTTLSWMFEGVLNYLLLIVIIVFQNDIRQGLVSIGAGQWRLPFIKRKLKDDESLKIICEAAEYMAARKIGALIVLEGRVPLGDYLERGVAVNADISKDLLVSLFWPNSPMHDGAVIIKGNKILAGGCILPLSEATAKRDYGTRHRAAMGITEQSDAVTVVVSEERGVASISLNGRLTDGLDETRLLRVLTRAMERVQ